MRKAGFTLIELLIVVAIIGILAALAIPNFLEAQTRAKTAKVKSEQRNLAMAMEQYALEDNDYPGDHDNDPYHPTQRGLYRLSTPIAYITNLSSFQDPFSQRILNPSNPLHDDDDHAPFYEMGSGCDNSRSRRAHCFEINSLGPDRRDDVRNNDGFPFGTNINVYDPTNGTISAGDILRFGGSYKSGNWTLHNIDYRLWAFGNTIPD